MRRVGKQPQTAPCLLFLGNGNSKIKIQPVLSPGIDQPSVQTGNHLLEHSGIVPAWIILLLLSICGSSAGLPTLHDFTLPKKLLLFFHSLGNGEVPCEQKGTPSQQHCSGSRRRLLSLIVLVTEIFKICGSCDLVNNSAKPIMDKRETLKGSLGGNWRCLAPEKRVY